MPGSDKYSCRSESVEGEPARVPAIPRAQALSLSVPLKAAAEPPVKPVTRTFAPSGVHRNRPVTLSGALRMSSGAPVATILPPSSPPPGPMSTM